MKVFSGHLAATDCSEVAVAVFNLNCAVNDVRCVTSQDDPAGFVRPDQRKDRRCCAIWALRSRNQCSRYPSVEPFIRLCMNSVAMTITSTADSRSAATFPNIHVAYEDTVRMEVVLEHSKR